MEKLTIIAEDTKNALGTLKEIIKTPYSVIVRDCHAKILPIDLQSL